MFKSFQIKLINSVPIILLVILGSYQIISAQTLPGQAPDFLWAQNSGGNGPEGAADLTVDIDGNIIVTGYFDSTVTFGSNVLTSSGSLDIYVTKYSPDGNVIWALRAGGSDYDQPVSVITDNIGNIIITGIFSGTAIFGTTTLNSVGSYNIFTAKYNANGDFLWVRQGIGESFIYANEVTTDNQDNILVTGVFSIFATFGTLNVQSQNQFNDIFVLKYSPLGDELWVEAAVAVLSGISSYNASYGVRTDINNNVFITGSFSSEILFGDTVLVSSLGGTNYDIFLAKYDSFGNFVWVTQAGGLDSNSYFNGEDIRIDKNSNILLTGIFQGNARFGNILLTGFERSDIFIANYDQSGNESWVIQDHGSTQYNVGREIDLDDAGNISLIANISHEDSSSENDNVYFARYTNTGIKLWGISTEMISGGSAGGIANDSKGDIYGCGYFDSSGSFGNITLNGENSEAFVVKLPSPKFAINPGIFNFGNIPVESEDSIDISLTNTSRANLHIFDFSLYNDTSASFGVLSGFPLDSIAALQSANIQLGFFPIYPGARNAFFEIVSDASTSPDTIFVSGTGIIREFTLSDNILDFGSIDVGINSNKILTLTNPSVVNIFIDSISISGNESSNFSFSPDVNGDTLYALGSINLDVSFSPDTSGLKNAYLIIYSTAGSSPDSVFLTGTGLSAVTVQIPSSPQIGQATTLSITPPNSNEFITSEIFYRKTGDLNYQQDTLSLQGNTYTFNIPPAFSTIAGIQFHIFFSDGSNIVTFPSLNPVTNPASIQVNIPQFNFPAQIKTNQYQMFSIPLSLNSSEIDSVFNDDYGSYDNKVWRIFRWQPGQNSYAEYDAISSNIVPGSAFWLINRDGKSFDVNNAVSVESNNNQTITLLPGYNQISDPFAFQIDWSSIGNSDLILQLPIRWNADIQDYEIDQDTLVPWEGYWVFNPLNQIININVNPNQTNALEKSSGLFASSNTNEFLLQIKATVNSSQAKDHQNFVGMIEDAKNDLDKYDVIKPPSINDELRVLIESGNNYFTRNVVPVSKDGAYWDFIVETKTPNQQTTLVVESIIDLPHNFNIWLIDKTRKIPLNINGGSAEIITNETGKNKLRIIVGTEEYANQNIDNISLTPVDFELYQNYPNPFNPNTTILFALPHPSSVSLKIYNILGELMAELINNQVYEEGYHEIKFDASLLSSGVYLYRIEADGFADIKKMLLLK